jgi:hypothetical protein
MPASSGKSWLKYGCGGCLAVIGLVVLLAVGLAGVAAIRARSEQVEDRVLTQELATGAAAAADSGGASAEPGRVILDLSHAEFDVRPAPPGEPIRVDARYDRGSYELVETLETGPDGGWTYRVRFRRTTSGLLTWLEEMFGGTRPDVRVLLPADVPMDLELRLAEGASKVELGGLWLHAAELTLEKGGFEVAIGEPLREPVERFVLRASMGGLELESLGNASPRNLDVEVSMGGFELDLGGHWLADAAISIDSRMSGTEVRLPRGVRIEGLEGSAIGPLVEPETPLPRLTFEVYHDERGEFRVIP